MLQQDRLPCTFGAARAGHISFGSSRWVYRANNFRELVEPFDIANYYRLELDRASGHYLEFNNRVEVYRRIEEMWRQHCRSQRPLLATYRSSVAWAEAMAVNPQRRAAQAAAAPAAGSSVRRLPPPVLPADSLPLVHRAL